MTKYYTYKRHNNIIHDLTYEDIVARHPNKAFPKESQGFANVVKKIGYEIQEEPVNIVTTTTVFEEANTTEYVPETKETVVESYYNNIPSDVEPVTEEPIKPKHKVRRKKDGNA